MVNLKWIGFALIIVKTLCLTMYLEYGQRYCFVEDRPALEDINLNFEIHKPTGGSGLADILSLSAINLRGSTPEEGLFAQIYPSAGQMKEFKIVDYKGVLFYPVENSGRNEICLINRLLEFKKSPDLLSISLKFSSGETETIAAPLVKGNETSQEYIQHTRQFASIIKRKITELDHYQDYEIKKEGEFKDSVERTNSIIQWCAILETIVFISVGIYQIFSLRRFFIRRSIF